MKTCTKCGEDKPLDAFYSRARRKDGREGSCKSCWNESSAKWYAEHPGYGRQQKLRMKYGMTVREFDASLSAQKGLCACCGTDDPGGPHGSFIVDHDHETGDVRGILCNRCNSAIGWLGDSAEGVAKALAYLTTDPR